MFRRNYVWRSAAVLGVAALVLAACGDGDDNGNGNGNGDPGAGDACTGEGLHIGTILPETGSLAFLGPPEFAGVDVAIDEINEAGGVLGECTVVSHTDSGDTETDIASTSADALIQQGAHAIIGSASSGVSFQFIDKLHEEGIAQVSPANTSPDFTTYENNDHYFRTAPSDVLQGRVLGDLILQDGNETVAILALQDAYGTGLLEYTTQGVEGGGGEVVLDIVYDPNAAEFSSEVAEVVAADPDAIVLITFDEFLRLAPELANAGVGPDVKDWYMVDGNLSNEYVDDLPEGFLEGVKGTLPGVDPSEMQGRMLEKDPALSDFSYGPESYDAAILIALAAVAAGSYEPGDIIANLQQVSVAPGTQCGPGADSNRTFADCVALLDSGEEIDYEGASGPINWDQNGDLTAATIGIYEYGADNIYFNVDYLFGEV